MAANKDSKKEGKLSTTEDKKKAKSASGGKLSKKVDSLVSEISKLSVMELSDLVNALQDKLGVSAAAPAAAPTVPQGGEEPTAGGAQTGGGAATQTVVITAAGDNKISVIKAIREVNQNLGLKEAKDMTESLPVEILKDAKADEAKEAADKLKTAGASVELK